MRFKHCIKIYFILQKRPTTSPAKPDNKKRKYSKPSFSTKSLKTKNPDYGFILPLGFVFAILLDEDGDKLIHLVKTLQEDDVGSTSILYKVLQVTARLDSQPAEILESNLVTVLMKKSEEPELRYPFTYHSISKLSTTSFFLVSPLALKKPTPKIYKYTHEFNVEFSPHPT